MLRLSASPSDVQPYQRGSRLILYIFSTGEQINIENWFGGDSIERVEFSDGTVWDAAAIQEKLELLGSDGDDTLEGSERDDVIYGNDGDDTLTGGEGDDRVQGDGGNDKLTGGAGDDVMLGGSGDDEYLINLGDGRDTIQDEGGANDRITLGEGITAASIKLTQSDNHLVITFIGTPDQVGIVDWFTEENRVETIQFADGSVYDVNAILAQVDANRDKVIEGTSGDDALEGAGGNDLLAGGLGDDTYTYGLGGGTDIIDENLPLGGVQSSGVVSTGFDTLVFGAGIRPEQLRAERVDTTSGGGSLDPNDQTQTGDLYIHVNDNDIVIVKDWFSDPIDLVTFTVSPPRIEQFEFADGTVWGTPQIEQFINGEPINYAPVVTTVLSDHEIEQGQAFTYTVPANTFVDPDGDTLSYSAALDDGSPLPAWLTFDATTGVFSGTPNDGETGILDIAVTATDATGLSITDVFRLNVGGVDESVIQGTPSDDTLRGGNNNETLNGGLGDDLLYGEGGNDVLYGGGGDDILFGDQTHDDLPGNDVLYGGEGSDALYGYEGDDELYGGQGDDTVYADEGNDLIDGGPGRDTLYGGAGVDRYLFGYGHGADIVDDYAHVRETNSVLLADGISGQDVSVHLDGEDLVLALGETQDQLVYKFYFTYEDARAGVYSAPSEQIEIRFADETVWDTHTILSQINLPDVETQTGTVNDDTFVVDSTYDFIEEEADGGIDTVESTASYSLPKNVENLTLKGFLNINADGNDLDNVIVGNSGNNVFDSSYGKDTYIGRSGDDIYYVIGDSVTLDTVVEAPDEGTDWVHFAGEGLYVLPDNVENLQLTSSSGAGAGNALDNLIIGRERSSNSLDGGEGADTLIGGSDSDRYYIDNPGDVIVEPAFSISDTVYSSISYQLPDYIEDLTLVGDQEIDGAGNDKNNILDGRTNLVANTLSGGGGDDTYFIHGGVDNVVELPGEGIDKIELTAPTYQTFSLDMFPNVENISLHENTKLVTLIGSDGDNEIEGNGFDNSLFGGGGNDLLTGFGQDDELYGGAGDDVLIGEDGEDIYDGGPGNDHLIDRLVSGIYGTLQRDTYLFGRDSGQDTILDYNSDGSHDNYVIRLYAMDKIVMADDVLVGDISLVRDGDSMIVRIDGTSDQITVENQFTSASYGIEEIVFADGTIWNEEDFNLRVGNQAPVVDSSLADQNVMQGSSFSFQLPDDAFSDPDGDSLSYHATLTDGSTLPMWLDFDTDTQTFSGTPENADVGTIEVRVTATDSVGLSVADNFTLSVSNVNDAPEIADTLPDQNANESEIFQFQVPVDTFVDPDGDGLTLSATLEDGSPLPAWLSFDAATGAFSGTPGSEDTGTLSIRVIATDGGGLQAADTFELTVDNVNDVPTAGADIVNTDEDTPLTVSAASLLANDSDTDGDLLGVTAVTNAVNGTVALNGTGDVVFTPAPDFNGEASFDYVIDDGNGGIATQTVTVNVAAVNDAPSVINPPVDQTALQGEALLYQLPADTFRDEDIGDRLTYGARLGNGDPLPSWLNFDAATQTFTGTPGAMDVGDLDIEVTATDDAGVSAATRFALGVGADDTGAPATVVDTGFESGTDGFTYVDDTFRGTQQGTYASGSHTTGSDDAALNVTLGGINRADILGMSGGWRREFTVSETGPASLTFRYNLEHHQNYESDEYSEVLVSVDGQLLGIDGNDYIARLSGDGNGGALSTTGWREVTLDLGVLDAGTHTVVIGGHNNKKTYSDEVANIYVDDVLMSVAASDNQAPTSIVLSDATVDENQPGAVVGTLSVSDADAGDVHTLSVDDPRFEIIDGQLKLKAGEVLDHEQQARIDLGITATDAGGLSVSEAFTLAVNDVNDNPVVASPISSQTAVGDDAFSFQIPTGTFADPDTGDHLSYTAGLSDGSSLPGWLSFDAGTQTFTGTPGATDVGDLAIEVTATDDAGANAAARFALSVGAGSSSAPVSVVDTDFESGADGFTYVDDAFRGTQQGRYASGSHTTTSDSGVLQVTVGGVNRADILGMSGGWRREFTVSETGPASLTFRYNLEHHQNYESDEYSEVLVSVDGQLLGIDGNEYIARLSGDGNGGQVSTTGWQEVTLDLGVLDAGTHTVIIGGHNNKKTYRDEAANIFVDDVRVNTSTLDNQALSSDLGVADPALFESQVQQMVNAMAAFDPPASGESDLSPAMREQLEPVLAVASEG